MARLPQAIPKRTKPSLPAATRRTSSFHRTESETSDIPECSVSLRRTHAPPHALKAAEEDTQSVSRSLLHKSGTHRRPPRKIVLLNFVMFGKSLVLLRTLQPTHTVRQ